MSANSKIFSNVIFLLFANKPADCITFSTAALSSELVVAWVIMYPWNQTLSKTRAIRDKNTCLVFQTVNKPVLLSHRNLSVVVVVCLVLMFLPSCAITVWCRKSGGQFFKLHCKPISRNCWTGQFKHIYAQKFMETKQKPEGQMSWLLL